MSLLSTDIAKVKRLSLREVKLPTTERKVEPITPILVERPPHSEEIEYSKLIAINPIVEKLVECLDLVSIRTENRINIIELKEEDNSPPELENKAKDKLITLAIKLIKSEDNYLKEDIIKRIKEETNVSQERAEIGFNLMLEERIIEQTRNPELYYLVGSLPF
jgi:hypothetical protein